MTPTLYFVLVYRWAVFVLAAGYALYILITSDYGAPGGPFRFLTNWALLLSFFCASRVLAYSEGRSDRRWDAVISATAVINAMVVFLYWRLYFADPTSVTRDGVLLSLWLELYLHLAGPALMWIDALFVHRSFRRVLPSLAVLLSIVILYLLWAELGVGPLNDTPIGTATSGLPYPFLNNLEPAARMQFYGVNVAVAVVLMAVFFGIAMLIRHVFGTYRPQLT